jgi:hypothetical protein
MHAAFFAKGAGIARVRNLGVIDVRAIAPTLARLLKLELPDALEAPLSLQANDAASE